MELLYGKPVREKILALIEDKIKSGISFNAYLIYNPSCIEASIYKNQIEKLLTKLNIPNFDCSISDYNQAKKAIQKANSDPLGMIFVSRPLSIENENELIEDINPNKDPDMLTSSNLGKLTKGNLNYLSGTSQAVRQIIDFYNISLQGKKVLVLGRSISVGLPIFLMTLKKNALASIVHSKISLEDISKQVRESEVIILATGKRGLVKKEDVNLNQIIIDCGYHEDSSGDLGFLPEAKMFTPVPKGVGPVTIASLILNAFFLIENSKK